MSELAERAQKIALEAEQLARDLRAQNGSTIEGECEVVETDTCQSGKISNEAQELLGSSKSTVTCGNR